MNQRKSDDTELTKEEQFIRSDIDLVPLLRGANTREERQKWAGAMNRADRDFPPEFYELLAE